MILVEGSVWVDHLRSGDAEVAAVLENGRVLTHLLVIGELALGHLKKRKMILADLQRLPQAVLAHDDEVLRFIVHHALHGLGIGYIDIDAHLLITPGAWPWTRDKRLHATTKQLGLASP